jgi:hypothetical protein
LHFERLGWLLGSAVLLHGSRREAIDEAIDIAAGFGVAVQVSR